jgi:hypothetical protein
VALFVRARRTDEEVFYRQCPANNWNVNINMHIDSLDKFPVGLGVIPVVRGRDDLMNVEVLCEVLAELIEILYVAIWPVYSLFTVVEVDV